MKAKIVIVIPVFFFLSVVVQNCWASSIKDIVEYSLFAKAQLPEELAASESVNTQQTDIIPPDGWALIDMEKYNEAVAAFSVALSANPESLSDLLGRSLAYIALEKFDLAFADTKVADANHPNNVYVNMIATTCCLVSQQFDKAKEYAVKTYIIDSYFHYSLINMGNYQLLTGNYKLAEHFYLQAVACVINPSDYDNITSDLSGYIEKGWHVEEAKKLKEHIVNNISTNKAKYIEMVEIEKRIAENWNNNNSAGAFSEYSNLTQKALSLSPPNYFKAMTGAYYIGFYQNPQTLTHYKQAIEYIEKGNVVHGSAANTYLYAGRVYEKNKDFTQALDCYHKSLKINEKLYNETEIAILSSNIGGVYSKIGENQKAILYLEKAITLDTKNKRIDGLAISYNNIGEAYKNMGNFTKAGEYYDKAIDIALNNNMTSLSTFYSMKGNLLLTAGDYQSALELFAKSYKLDEKANNRINMAKRLNSLGNCYYQLRQFDQAIEKCNKCITISKSEGDVYTLANAHNILGAVYDERKNYSLALENYTKSLELNRKLNDKTALASVLTNLGGIYTHYNYNPEKARGYFKEAEKLFRQLNDNSNLAKVLNSLGGLGIAIASSNNNVSQLSSSVAYYKEAIAINEELRKGFEGEQRVKYFESIIYSYELLTATYIYMNNYTDAINTLEISRAKSLSEKLAKQKNVKPVTLNQIQAKLTEKQAVLYYANTVQNPMSLIVITKNSINGYQLKKDKLIKQIVPTYGNQIVSVINQQRGFKRIDPESESTPIPLNNEQLKKKNALEDIVNFYRTLLNDPSNQEKQELAGKFASELHQFLVNPSSAQLVGKTELTIIADGILAYLPFETLIDNNNKYLVESTDIKYLHSLTVENLLNSRTYSNSRNQLLALGGAKYDAFTDNTSLIKSTDELYSLRKQVKQKLNKNESLYSCYASLGIVGWQHLPGTLSEVNNIKQIIPSAKLLVANECSEGNIKTMSKNNSLANYKIVHFASHGLVVPEIPELSALVLSLSKTLNNSEDGYLSMNEIEKLNLKADFVNLSACETGLGKIYGGEGVVGLSQSFLIAGANGLSVSLWKVADQSTSQFMVALYKKLNAQNGKYAKSIAEIKRSFIKGEFGDGYRLPYYWAPFVYYGM